MKKTLAVLFAATIAVVVACTSPTAPQPEPQRDVANVSTPNPVAGAVAPVVSPTAGPQGQGWEGSIGPFASWSVKNLESSARGYTAYYTNFDDQKKRLGSKAGRVQPNDVFSGTFNQTCVQIDVEHEGGGAPFLSGYINHLGAVVNQHALDLAKCAPPQCVEKWIEQEPVITYGEWGECKAVAGVTPACAKSRSVRTVINEKNSCTGAARVKSDKTTSESAACECKCVDKVTYSGTFTVDSLTNDGNGYVIKDDGVDWKTGLNLKVSGVPYSFAHDVDDSKLCLWWKTENLGCAYANKTTCEVERSWHAQVSFKCKAVHSCPQ